MLKFRLLLIFFLSFLLVSCSYPMQIIRDEFLKDQIQDQSKEEIPDITPAGEDKRHDEAPHESAGATPETIVEEAEPSPQVSDADVAESDDPSKNEQQRRAQDQENMDEALELLAQSQLLWEKGDLDNALDVLDHAFSLILDVNGEPDIAWQKDDLRFMIAKRILEIYTSRSKVATGYESEIPLTMNADVEKEILRFQRGERRFFIESYRRSGMYRPVIVKQLRNAGLPEELSWLPLVESGFKFQALSKARALGLWQIIPSTGYKFGLKRDHFIDERMDLEKSTNAAITYLKELHGIFGDWLTVLAAYNCGEGRVLRTISRQHMNYLDNFWDLYRQLPIETAHYVPRFLAALHIIKDPQKYGMDLGGAIDQPITYDIVKSTQCMRLKDIAGHLKIPDNKLTILNAELRFIVTPDKEYDLKVPRGTAEQFTLVANDIPKSKIPGSAQYIRHKIKKGETLSTIAMKYRCSVSAIVRANHLSSKHRISAGKWLKIPLRGYSFVEEETGRSVEKVITVQRGETINYNVKQGDSLWLLAKRFNMTVSRIKQTNGLRSDRLQIGQNLKIQNGSASAEVTYIVRKGDCLGSIAEKYRITVHELLRLNNLSEKDNIYPGQVIIVVTR